MITSDWKGFVRHESQFEGHRTLIVLPHEAAPGKPWIWRAEFFGAFDWVDLEMLRRGWHLAYCQVSDMYGCSEAIETLHRFKTHITEEYGLAPKAAMFGFSRGGLYATNYAMTYPEDICSLYLDAPVLDVRSWPGGFGKSERYEKEWEECKVCYGIDEASAPEFDGSPLFHLDRLLSTEIPIFMVGGDSDEVVPFDENGERLVAHYRSRGVDVPCIVKPGCGHHPHSLENPTPVADFLELHK